MTWQEGERKWAGRVKGKKNISNRERTGGRVELREVRRGREREGKRGMAMGKGRGQAVRWREIKKRQSRRKGKGRVYRREGRGGKERNGNWKGYSVGESGGGR